MRQVIFRKDGTGGYTAEVPSLPGCKATGKNLNEIVSAIRKAIYAYVADLEAKGEPLPESTMIEVAKEEGVIVDRMLLHEDVVQAVKDTFPNDDVRAILDVLSEYGTRPFEMDTERVQVAAVHLSEGKIDRLKLYVSDAKRDYRDVIAAYGIKYGRYP